MNFEIYCDESNPDVFKEAEKKQSRPYLLIGSIWLPADLRAEIKESISFLKKQHNCLGELKWSKVSITRLEFYKDLIDMFLGYGLDLRFRAIAVEAEKVNWEIHGNDNELGFYKFYYQLIHHWILDFNNYNVFCDTKTNRDATRLPTLKRCLQNSNLLSEINSVQALPSSEVVIMQLTDFFLGMVNARLNKAIQEGGAKDQVIKHLEQRLGISELAPTSKTEEKFNIFRIKLAGGW